MKIAERDPAREFHGKVALVTGAGTGVGEGIAERLFLGGASVALLGRRVSSVAAVCKRLDPEGQRTLALEADVRDALAVKSAVAGLIEHFGKLDLAINNAGVTGPAMTPLHELELDAWREVIDTDLTGVFHA